MFGGMEQQTEDGRRQAGAADRATLEHGLGRCAPQLIERPIDRARHLVNQHRSGCARRPFLGKRRTLRVGEALATRIGEQAIQAAGEVLQMVSGRRGAVWPLPQLIVRRVDGRANILAGLHERMGRGHQDWGESRQRTTQPRLWWSHRAMLAFRDFAVPCLSLYMAMRSDGPELVVLYEHPEWQKPLFAALERRGMRFEPFDLKSAAFGNVDALAAPLYFNQASPSAYVRGNVRAVPLALAYMRTLERLGARVLNGADVFALELSKSAQATLLHTLAIDTPRSITFNDVAALRPRAREMRWPALLKPDQGGSGARIHVVESVDHVAAILDADPSLWLPDNLFLLQELLDHDPEAGIVRLEFLGGELLYAMRVKTHGRFNLCPSPVCNPDEGDGVCAVPAHAPDATTAPVEFFAFPEVPGAAVDTATRIVRAARLDVGGIEYLETPDGRRVFYDINANSNLRPSVAAAFGFDPFERVVDFLQRESRRAGVSAARTVSSS